MNEEEFLKLSTNLDGKYFVFRWTDHDINFEGSCIAVYQLQGKILRGIIGGDRYAEEMEMNEEISDRSVDWLIKNGIREVYSIVGATSVVFGLQTYYENPRELNKKREINEWSSLELICREDEEYELLEEKGVKIKFLDYGTGEIF